MSTPANTVDQARRAFEGVHRPMRVGENGELATTADIGWHFRQPISTIRRWAVEDGWTRFGSVNRRYWNLEQVEKSAIKRGLLDPSA